MSRLRRWFAQPDKVFHFAAGAFVYAVQLGVPVPVSDAVRITAALSIVAALGWGKERYDKAHPSEHTADGWDAYATLLGGLACALGIALARAAAP